MGEQLTLDHAPVDVDTRKLPLDQQWALFIDDNPHLVGQIRTATFTLLNVRNTDRIGMAAVWEELRYRTHTTGEPYRLDNSFRAPAADWMMAQFNDLDGVYVTRSRKRGRR